jgi:hypothetical protein
MSLVVPGLGGNGINRIAVSYSPLPNSLNTLVANMVITLTRRHQNRVPGPASEVQPASGPGSGIVDLDFLFTQVAAVLRFGGHPTAPVRMASVGQLLAWVGWLACVK